MKLGEKFITKKKHDVTSVAYDEIKKKNAAQKYLQKGSQNKVKRILKTKKLIG